MTQYRKLSEKDIHPELFRDFIRRQDVTDCWRKENGRGVIKPDPFVDDWSQEDYLTLVRCLRHTAASGGFVYAAFPSESLKGFASVEPGLFGGEQKYLELSSIHVSRDMRGQGMGRVLFRAAAEWARDMGARKLYISAHSAVESQAFYRSLGCVEAQVYSQEAVEKEPYDCQLEYNLQTPG